MNATAHPGLVGRSRQQTAWRMAQDIPEGYYVNLGIGAPELVANYIPDGREVILHSENGILGMGPAASAEQRDDDLINAGKKHVTLLPGGAYFHHADSFSMIRGRHLDLCVLGAFEVSADGDLANWTTGGAGAVPAVGGAMDLAVGARLVYVLTDHRTRAGQPKILKTCSFPLTGLRCINRIYTDLCIFEVTSDGPGLPRNG